MAARRFGQWLAIRLREHKPERADTRTTLRPCVSSVPSSAVVVRLTVTGWHSVMAFSPSPDVSAQFLPALERGDGAGLNSARQALRQGQQLVPEAVAVRTAG